MKTKEQSETDNAIDRMVEKAKKQGRKEGIAEVFNELDKYLFGLYRDDVITVKKKYMVGKA